MLLRMERVGGERARGIRESHSRCAIPHAGTHQRGRSYHGTSAVRSLFYLLPQRQELIQCPCETSKKINAVTGGRSLCKRLARKRSANSAHKQIRHVIHNGHLACKVDQSRYPFILIARTFYTFASPWAPLIATLNSDCEGILRSSLFPPPPLSRCRFC